jgi:hypothetical protein
VPRDRIEKALIEELRKADFTDLRAAAASVGLSSKRRLYKDFRDLRLAIVAKNATIKKRWLATDSGRERQTSSILNIRKYMQVYRSGVPRGETPGVR